jgi:hypothetical protein
VTFHPTVTQDRSRPVIGRRPSVTGSRVREEIEVHLLRAIVPKIVPANFLTDASALDQFVQPASRVLRPALGGLLVA